MLNGKIKSPEKNNNNKYPVKNKTKAEQHALTSQKEPRSHTTPSKRKDELISVKKQKKKKNSANKRIKYSYLTVERNI